MSIIGRVQALEAEVEQRQYALIKALEAAASEFTLQAARLRTGEAEQHQRTDGRYGNVKHARQLLEAAHEGLTDTYVKRHLIGPHPAAGTHTPGAGHQA